MIEGYGGAIGGYMVHRVYRRSIGSIHYIDAQVCLWGKGTGPSGAGRPLGAEVSQ